MLKPERIHVHSTYLRMDQYVQEEVRNLYAKVEKIDATPDFRNFGNEELLKTLAEDELLRKIELARQEKEVELVNRLCADDIITHYVAVQQRGHRESIVGHAVVSVPNREFVEGWRLGLPKSRRRKSGPRELYELRGTTVDPKAEGLEIKERILEKRRFDINESLGGVAVAAIHEQDTEWMSLVDRFGGRIAAQHITADNEQMNLVVFPTLDQGSLLYLGK